MAIRLPYETKAGNFSEAETQMQLLEYVRLAAECCYAIGHYRKANGDEFSGQGYLAIGQMWEKQIDGILKTLAQKGQFQ